MYGVGTELGHITDGDTVTLESSDPTDEDPIEWVNIHVTSSSSPVWSETRSYDEASDMEPGPMETVRTMESAEGGPAAEAEVEEVTEEVLVEDDEEASYDEWTVEELKDALRSRGLMVSGVKDELVARLEGDDELAEEDSV